MKKILLRLSVLFTLFSSAQTYPSQNISLLGHIDPDTENTSSSDNRHYAGCWGWHQASLNKEYAIVGGSNGTYFIDVTNPSTPTVSAFVPGRTGCTWREIKTYQNYCYVVSDDYAPNTFQIIDMSNLPNSVSLVHNSNSLFERGHTIYIDQDKMYIGATTYSTGNLSAMNLYSLATPTAPVLLRTLQQDLTPVSYVHDMFVRNDTIYASTGYTGLFVFKYNTASNTFSQLGSYTGYSPGSAYNHSSMLTKNGKYLFFCDEVPAGLPMHFVNVQNLNNIQPVQTFMPHPNTTSHNPYVIGNNWAVVASYQDGIHIYDISQPGNVGLAGYFDTFPQGGFNVGNYNSPNDDRGNWGAYPYLPSGIIIATDMQNGVFILDPTAAFNNPVGVKNNSAVSNNVIMYPNPARDFVSINYSTVSASKMELRNNLGQLLLEKQYSGNVMDQLNVSDFSNGTYILTIIEKEKTINKKLIVNH